MTAEVERCRAALAAGGPGADGGLDFLRRRRHLWDGRVGHRAGLRGQARRADRSCSRRDRRQRRGRGPGRPADARLRRRQPQRPAGPLGSHSPPHPGRRRRRSCGRPLQSAKSEAGAAIGRGRRHLSRRAAGLDPGGRRRLRRTGRANARRDRSGPPAPAARSTCGARLSSATATPARSTAAWSPHEDIAYDPLAGRGNFDCGDRPGAGRDRLPSAGLQGHRDSAGRRPARRRSRAALGRWTKTAWSN